MRIGVDFDNTIAGYDGLFSLLARESGLLSVPPDGGKRAIRDALRERPDGEVLWQKLQAAAYGPRMQEAEIMPGVQPFLSACRRRGIAVFVVSHKTRYANFDEDRVDLRKAALMWLERHRFFGPEGLDHGRKAVFFENTRREKLGRIADLKLSHFIDDLEEVFEEQDFPQDVEAILYAPHGTGRHVKGAISGPRAFADWDDITEHLLG